jgi:hypothetical protein
LIVLLLLLLVLPDWGTVGTWRPRDFLVRWGTGTGGSTTAGRGISGCVGVPGIICFGRLAVPVDVLVVDALVAAAAAVVAFAGGYVVVVVVVADGEADPPTVREVSGARSTGTG